MDWVISVSEAECADGALLPQTTTAAYRALRAQGAVVLRRVFPESTIEGVYQEYHARYGALDAREMGERAVSPAPNALRKRAKKRFEIAPQMDGAFADPTVIANPLLRHFLPSLLGDDMCLSVFVVVVSFPGAPEQPTHRDHPHLFPEVNFGAVIPPFAITVAVPLVSVDHEMGPTGVWLGSHLWANNRMPDSESITSISFDRGDCMILDYRTIHAGLANISDLSRPILYMTYCRKWFIDSKNYEDHSSLNMSLETFNSLPETVRPVLIRAYTQAMNAKHIAETNAPAPG